MHACKKQLQYLIQSKRQDISTLGVSDETLSVAKWRAQFFIEKGNPITDKKLRSLLAASLLINTKNKVTERQLEKIFGITRKTIRKWKEILLKDRIS